MAIGLYLLSTSAFSTTTTTSSTTSTLPDNYGSGSYQALCDTFPLPLAPSVMGRKKITIKNFSTSALTAYLCIGNNTCTTSNGYPLKQNEVYEDTNWKGSISCISASGNPTLAVIEE